jgi:hypothetical protein
VPRYQRLAIGFFPQAGKRSWKKKLEKEAGKRSWTNKLLPFGNRKSSRKDF